MFFEQDIVDELCAHIDRKKPDEVILCMTEFMFVINGSYVQDLVEFEVISFIENIRVFNLYNRELNVHTTRSRFNL